MMMTLAKIKTVCLVLALLGVAGIGAGWMVRGGGRGQREAATAEPNPGLKAHASPQPKEKAKGVDLYGDPLPEGVAMRLGTVRLRGVGSNVVLSGDGKTLIGVRGAKYLRFWDVESGKLKEVRELAGTSSPNSVLSPDGRWMANWTATATETELRIFDVQSGKVVHALSTPDAKAIQLWLPTFSPDGKYVSTAWHVRLAKGSSRSQVRIWDLADLASDVYSTRDAASKRLKELGTSAEAALHQQLKAKVSLEVRQRIEVLLKMIAETRAASAPDNLRDLRGVAVLARIQSPQARRILEELLQGADLAPLTIAAKAALLP